VQAFALGLGLHSFGHFLKPETPASAVSRSSLKPLLLTPLPLGSQNSLRLGKSQSVMLVEK
jgi:hypothetical protein